MLVSYKRLYKACSWIHKAFPLCLSFSLVSLFLPLLSLSGISISSPPLSLWYLYFFPSSLSLVSLFLPLLSLSGISISSPPLSLWYLYFFPSSLSLVSLFLPLLSLSGISISSPPLSLVHFHDATVESDDDDEPLLDGGDSHEFTSASSTSSSSAKREHRPAPFSLASSLVNVESSEGSGPASPTPEYVYEATV